MKKNVVFWTVLAAFAAALAWTASSQQEGSPPDTSDELIRTFSVTEPPALEPRSSDPGEEPKLARAFEGSPPLVPHSVVDMLPITRSDNLCVDCHLTDEAGEGDPTPIPESHYRDLRRAPEKVGETMAGARYVCVSCHVAPSAAAPLVGNRF